MKGIENTNGIVLKVVNLKKYYKNVKAVDGISFEVRKGEIFALLGPNGAGKTTTMEILEGLRKADDGEVYYFGRRIKEVDRSIKEKIGVQLQDPAFFEHLTVREILYTFRGLYKRKKDVDELIDLMGLREKEKSKVKELSGGQLKRLAIAAALVNDPSIVFLDEPTTGLDPQARRAVWDIILNLKKEGKTVFLTTHYMEEAERLADRVFVMDHGKIIANGSVDELIGSLNMENVIVFEVKNSASSIMEKFKLENMKKVSDDGYEITTKDVERDLSRIFELSRELGLEIENLIIRKPNLEDVFLNLTGRTLRD